MSGVLESLIAEVLESRPRRGTDLSAWIEREGPHRRYIAATARVVDITHRPAVTVIQRGLPFTDHELARPYLRMVHREQAPRSGMAAKRIPWSREALGHLRDEVPHYFGGPPLDGEWAYVDLRRAFPSIYGALTLDLNFRPHADRPRLGVGRFELLHADELREIENLHRAIGGIIRATRMTVWDHGTSVVYEDTWKWSPLLCPDLWGVIVWTLHAVARLAVHEHGAVMVCNDGYVVPRDRAEGLRAAIAEQWQLDSVVRTEGRGTVYSVNSWKIGRRRTKTEHRRSPGTNNLLPVTPAIERLLRQVRSSRLARL